jgi:hypothetical protein
MTTTLSPAALILTKEVGYSYASSENANRFGFRKTGCYTVSTIEGTNPPVAVSGHATRDEALAAARLLPEAWNASFLRHNLDVTA